MRTFEFWSGLFPGARVETPDLDPVRQILLRRVVALFLVLGLPAVAVGSFQSIAQGRWWYAACYGAFYLLAAVVLAVLRRIPYRTSASIVMASMFAFAVAVLVRLGLSGTGISILIAFTALVSVFAGFSGALAAVVLGAAAIALVGAGMVSGFIPSDPRLELSSRSPAAWVNAGAVYVLLGVVMVIAPRMLLARLAQALARTRESERHHEELAAAARRRSQDLELLDRVRTAMAAETGLPDLFRTVVESIAAAFGYTQVSLYTIEGDFLALRHQVGYREVFARIPLDKGVSGRVVRTRAPVLVEDVRTDPDFLGAFEGIVSEVCVPLFDGERTVGILNIESMGGVRMGGDDLRLMTVLGAQVSVAIARARLYEEARESERRYRSLVENLGEGIAVVDADERFVFANPAAEATFGVPRGELAGRSLREFLSEAEFSRARQETARRQRGERSVYEQQIIRSDGAVRRIELSATPHQAPDGHFDGTFAVFRDITDYRRLEQSLERERVLLLTLVNSLPDITYLKDRDGRFVLADQAAARFFGVADSGALVGRTEADLLPGDTGAGALRDDRAVMAGTIAVDDRQEVMLTAAGASRWMLTSKVPIRDAEGRVTGLVGIHRDVTGRKEAEEKLLNFIEQSPEAIMLTDGNGTVLEFNPSAEQLSGIPRKSAIGEPIWNVMDRSTVPERRSAESLARLASRIRGVLQTGRARFLNRPINATLRRPDGELRQIQQYLFPIKTARGWQIGYIGHDLTEARRTEEALHASEERLAQAQKLEALGRLAGGIAHDFNNLLTVIRGYADLLADRLPDGNPLRADVVEIARAASRAAELTAQLLAFSRKQVMEPRVVRLNDVVDGMKKMLPRILGEDIVVEYRTDRAAGSVRVDPGQIERVIMNLAVNARDAMPGGGSLVIETSVVTPDAAFLRAHPEVPPGEYAVLSVSDTGSGMDRGTLARIFEPFFTTKATGKGTGLGLSMVYGVVKQSNGFIYCTSEPGRGTTFRIYLSRQPDAAPDGGANGPAAAARAGTGTVLVVEDEDGIRALARTVLQRQGYEVFTAAGGPEALELVRRRGGGFDLLLTDVVMPRMNGAELASRLEELCPGLKVLYMSGYAESALARHSRLEEGVDLLQKPFDPDTLLERVSRALGRAP